MRRTTHTLLLVAIIVLLAVGVTAAVLRETRDEELVTAQPGTTVPSTGAVTPSSLPTTTTTGTTVAPVPTTRAPVASAPTVPGTAAVPPSTTVVPSTTRPPPPTTRVPPPSAMPNTGAELPPAFGLALVVTGLLGRGLSRRTRPTR